MQTMICMVVSSLQGEWWRKACTLDQSQQPIYNHILLSSGVVLPPDLVATTGSGGETTSGVRFALCGNECQVHKLSILICDITETRITM